jgi:hypothetical protein
LTIEETRSVTASFMGESSISVQVQKKSARLKVSGLVTPAHSSGSVSVQLFKKKNGEFVKIGKKNPELGTDSRYATGFARPSGKKCRIRAEFTDEDHVPSKIVKSFNC